jgi:hypothetical protein
MINGAGGTQGGIGMFVIGVVMMLGGFYLLLNAIMVSSSFGFGFPLFGWGGFSLTSGMLLIPMMFGVGMIFYNAKNWLGWLLAGGALVALIFGVISSLHFSFQSMTAFNLIIILVLSMGGTGLFLRSLKSF